MSQWVIVTVVGSLAILIFDLCSSLASQRFGIRYGLFSVGSVAIYFVTGFVAGKAGSIGWAMLAAIIVGGIEATLGWYISWIIGPGRIEEGLTFQFALFGVGFTILLAFIFGFLGALFAKLVY